MFDQVHPDWLPLFKSQQQLLDEILARLQNLEFVPAAENVFRAFRISPKQIKVLIVGQDPYPNPDHAIGLAFAVSNEVTKLPASLRNILRELQTDLGEAVSIGDISVWEERGVMLLNRHLTTAPHEIAGHLAFGWDRFTTAAVQYLNEQRAGKLVAILWGNKAAELAGELSEARVIQSAHPSPLSASRGFFGSQPFSKCNKALLELGLEPVDWRC